jgi:DNA-binding transcriptional ArsR family regulator
MGVTAQTERILEILRHCPYGLTAKEVAERLGATPSTISSQLRKLADHGAIIKTRGRIAHNASPCAIYKAAAKSAVTETASAKAPRVRRRV